MVNVCFCEVLLLIALLKSVLSQFIRLKKSTFRLLQYEFLRKKLSINYIDVYKRQVPRCAHGTHLSSSSRAVTPEAIYSASRGHTAVQQPQATHSLPMPATLGDRFIQGLLCKCISNSDITNILYGEVLVKCDDETVSMEGRSDWFG